MTVINVKELIERNKQLENENKTLKERILSNILLENTEVVRLNFKLLQLERRVDTLTAENVKLRLFS